MNITKKIVGNVLGNTKKRKDIKSDHELNNYSWGRKIPQWARHYKYFVIDNETEEFISGFDSDENARIYIFRQQLRRNKKYDNATIVNR